MEYRTPAGGKGFAGIEVKYHEALGDPPAPHRARYDEIAKAMGAFKPDAMERLKKKPLQQIWRDHLLSGALLLDRDEGYAEGIFVFLYPKDNVCCATAVVAYEECLANMRSFVSWTLEDLAAAIKAENPPWIDLFVDRYLAFGKIPV